MLLAQTRQVTGMSGTTIGIVVSVIKLGVVGWFSTSVDAAGAVSSFDFFAHSHSRAIRISFLTRFSQVALFIVWHPGGFPPKALNIGWGIVNITSSISIEDNGCRRGDITAEKFLDGFGKAEAFVGGGFTDEGIKLNAGVFIDSKFKPRCSAIGVERVGIFRASVPI